jgi:hypothetical protein
MYYGTESPCECTYLILDGSTFNESKFPKLYALLGNSNTLPDFRGYFPRALNTGSSGVDPNRTLGSI